MRTPLRIGIVGCGRAAESLHVPGCLRVSDVRVVAVADRIPERRERIVAAVPDCMSFESLPDLIEGAAPDAILITTPPEEHGKNAADAMRAGVPLLVEKPLALTLEEA
jgi:predicted dehydrogenase